VDCPSLVSAVVPAHNRSKYIQRAVESVLAQTYSNLEVMVVDDGSIDNTVQVVQECARRDGRVRLVEHGRQRGAQAARNTGIRAARGEWIAFLDSDDEWLSDSLEARLQRAAAERTEVVHSECYILKPDNSELQLFCLPPMGGRVYKQLLRRSGTMFQGMLASKNVLARIGYLDEAIVSFQEWETSIRLAKHYRFSFCPTPTFIYDCSHQDSISKDLARTARGYEQVFRKHRWSILRYVGPKALASHYQMAAGLYRKANDERNARRCLMRANVLWPFQPRAI
jgi:glycosyltransferase involved in cell wall biosynthesis